MKRTEALKPLSREHHHALFMAKEIKDASESEGDEVRSAFLEFWRTEGALHFRIEEEVLLPGSGLPGPDRDEEVARMLSEHLAIRRQAARVESGEADLAELKRLGESLKDHVRFEERDLFPRIEREMTADELIPLAAAIEAAEKDHFGGPAARPPRRD